MIDFFTADFNRVFKERFGIDYDDFETINRILETRHKAIGIGEASAILGVSIETLRNWDKKGVLTSFKTKGGHRKYFIEDIVKFSSARSPKQIFLMENGEKWIIRPYDYYPLRVSDIVDNSVWWNSGCKKAFEEGIFHWFDNFEDCVNLCAELRHKFIEKDKTQEEIKARLKKGYEHGE